MTLSALQTKANNNLQTFWDNFILPKQIAYWNRHGTFFGFNWTPANPVVDGVDTDFGDVQRPSRKHFAADVSFTTNEQVPYQIQIVRHHGTEHGFTAMVRVELPDGRRFLRTRTAYPVVQAEVWDNTDPENPVLTTPATITDWNITTSAWEEIYNIV